MKKGLVHWFIISTFISLYLIVSIISTIHVIEFFSLSNPYWLSVSLAIAFEVGAAASLASLIVLDKMNKLLVWVLFITLTFMQAMGNTYYAFTNLHDYQSWIELFGLVDEDVIYQKRMLSLISGAILPLIALGFIKSLVDYIKPSSEILEKSKDAQKNLESSDDETEKSETPFFIENLEGGEQQENPVSEDYKHGEIVDPSLIREDLSQINDQSIEGNQIQPEIQHINMKRIEDPVLRYRESLKK
jgi:glucan phosphoethanolaminetransferase (alkaline phosphatase superfamily)